MIETILTKHRSAMLAALMAYLYDDTQSYGMWCDRIIENSNCELWHVIEALERLQSELGYTVDMFAPSEKKTEYKNYASQKNDLNDPFKYKIDKAELRGLIF